MKVYENYPLSRVLFYQIGGKVKYLIDAYDKNDILQAVEFIQKNPVPRFYIVGTGANILFPDGTLNATVLRIIPNKKLLDFTVKYTQIETYAGELLDDVIQFTFQHNLTGLEWAAGIPGTVGAAVRGNVGAFGKEIKHVFVQAEVVKLDSTGYSITTLDHGNFTYRSSLIKTNKNIAVISAKFNLNSADTQQLDLAKQKYNDHIEYRKKNHPLEYPSCGSVFKNINDEIQVNQVLTVYPELKLRMEKEWNGIISVGYLIERLGFTGYQIGQAQVAEKHKNFIINLGGAKYTDVLGIIRTIQDKFISTFGFVPETEVEIIPPE